MNVVLFLRLIDRNLFAWNFNQIICWAETTIRFLNDSTKNVRIIVDNLVAALKFFLRDFNCAHGLVWSSQQSPPRLWRMGSNKLFIRRIILALAELAYWGGLLYKIPIEGSKIRIFFLICVNTISPSLADFTSDSTLPLLFPEALLELVDEELFEEILPVVHSACNEYLLIAVCHGKVLATIDLHRGWMLVLDPVPGLCSRIKAIQIRGAHFYAWIDSL